MFASSRIKIARLASICALCFLIVFCGYHPVRGDSSQKKSSGKSISTLRAIGTVFDSVRALPLAERQIAVKDVSMHMAEFMRSDYPKRKRFAAHFLSGEILYELGDYEAAAEEFDEARDNAEGGNYGDDAAAAKILAMEAAGRDGEAAREWVKWEKKYKNSPFTQEVCVARAWNALRRADRPEASRLIKDLENRFPWMKEDPRVILAEGVIAYIEERYEDALSQLAGVDESAGVLYLRALVYEATGASLKAAAQYREVVERYRHSPLRDTAMLAKANIFLSSHSYKSAEEELERVVSEATRDDIRGEAMFRKAAAVYLDGRPDEGTEMLCEVVALRAGTDLAARAQFLLGEILFENQRYEEAVVEFNKVLASYFEHELAPRAQYRIGRSLDALGRGADATSTYQAVVAGYPLAPESPAAAYLAGAGLLDLGRPNAAAPYFQIVLDRYARSDSTGELVFADEAHRELVEASLCLLELSYHRAGSLGQLSGAPHMMLKKMPSSDSPWRANALLIDADALASQARYPEAEKMLKQLVDEFPDPSIAVPATRLLAWTYARQGKNSLAIETEEQMLAKYGSYGGAENLGLAYFNKANILFNRKEYLEAGTAYDEFLRRYAEHPKRLQALYRAGLCYQRIDQNGDAVDRWEALVASDSTAEIAELAWVRCGDLYFRAEHYDDAKRCYAGLLKHFSGSSAASLGMLRIAQCEYNAGNDEEALRLFSDVISVYPYSPYAREAEKGMEQALYRLGQREDGVEVLAELVKRYPTSSFAADAQFEIAMRSYKAENYRNAAEEFRRVVSQFPGFSAADRAHYLMADAYRRAGLQREARLAYEQFLSFFPESEFKAMVHFHLGSLRFENEEYLHAAIDFTSILEEEAPREISAAALFNLALCKRVLGESEEAGNLLRRYRQEYSSNDKRAVDIACQIAGIHDEAGRTGEAVEEYRSALAADPSSDMKTEIYYRMGLCNEELQNIKGALAAYRKAAASKNKRDSFRLLAVARTAAICEEQKDFSGALAAYRELIEYSADAELVVAAKERASHLENVLE